MTSTVKVTEDNDRYEVEVEEHGDWLKLTIIEDYDGALTRSSLDLHDEVIGKVLEGIGWYLGQKLAAE